MKCDACGSAASTSLGSANLCAECAELLHEFFGCATPQRCASKDCKRRAQVTDTVRDIHRCASCAAGSIVATEEPKVAL